MRNNARPPAYRDRFTPIDKFTMMMIINRAQKVEYERTFKPKRKNEIMCPDCHMILSKQASSCFC